MTDELVAVGRVGPARGMRGDVFVEPRTDAPDERFAVGANLHTEPESVGPLQVAAASRAGGRLVVHFRGIDERADAELLRGVSLFVAASTRPPLDDPDEFYDSDLVGLSARAVDGAQLGAVTAVRHTGATTHLVIRVDGRDRLIPFVSAIVPSVDLAAGVLVVDPPEGLLDL